MGTTLILCTELLSWKKLLKVIVCFTEVHFRPSASQRPVSTDFLTAAVKNTQPESFYGMFPYPTNKSSVRSVACTFDVGRG
jgi:hypothetical protein